MAEIGKKGASKPSQMDNYNSRNTAEVVISAIDATVVPVTV
jgi:hypothetical protein